METVGSHRTGFIALAVFILVSIPATNSLRHTEGACPEGQFLCQDGDCIRESKICDGIGDCRDGDDESDCALTRCEAPDWFHCESGKCIASSFVCDGENDCGEYEDEKDCHLFSITVVPENCTEDQFRCTDGVCIPEYMVCDGTIDCMDGSDEVLGCSGKVSCENDFMCKNKYCVPLSFHCDGAIDCSDGSDEENCPKASSVVPMSECLISSRFFPCADHKTCIELSEVCDRKPDCPDASDEGALCTEKNQCSKSKCQHQCFPTPTGPVCTCHRGSKLVNNTCIDVDECKHFGFCDQRCQNLNGTYKCYCDEGYTLQSDRRSCKVEGGEAMMVFGAGSSIRTYYLTSHVLYPIAKNQGQIAGIGYDGDYVYWTNVMKEDESIMRCEQDGTNSEVIVTAGLGLPEDLSVDWITRNIYFTDSEMKHIGVCTNDGAFCTVLINDDIDKPRCMALHPALRYMYWTDWGKEPHIGRAGMDGSDPVALVNSDIIWPNGLTVDYHNDRIYWVDAKRQKIETIKLDGSDRRVVLEHEVRHPFDIAIFEDTLYWSDWEGLEIQSCNKFTGKNRTLLVRERKHKVYGVHIFHSSMQHKNISNPCLTAACSHICLLAPNPLGYACACREDSVIAPDKHTCRVSKKNELIFVSAGQLLVRIEPRTLGKLHHTPISLTAIHTIGPITYDSIEGKIIIYDIGQKHIYSYDHESGRLDVILANAIGHITDMDYDYTAGNLYWTDAERETVEVMSMSTRERAVLLRDTGRETPMSITLVPEENAMYVAFYRAMEVHIDRFHMDGIGGRSHFVEAKLEGPTISMLYDQELHRIFWSDSGTQMIESAAVDGADRHQTRTLLETVNDIASLGNDIFWVDRYSGMVHWINKYDGNARSKKLDVGLIHDVQSPHIVAVRGKRVVPDHPCQQNNGECTHICLASFKTPVCACPDGLILRHDNRTCVTPIACASTQFKCKSDNTCIPKHKRCNGHKDCINGDDELDCTHNCPSGQLACSNGQCINAAKKCDGTTDCADNSDELNCHNTTCNPIFEFTCNSGMCITSLGRCNEVNECDDGSDEDRCDETICDPERNFRCNSGACIPRNWECDRQVDCPDGSDEHSKCPPKECSSKQFTCKNKRCVDKALKCDLVDDCGDNSDEDGCQYILEEDVAAMIDKSIDCFAGEFPCHSSLLCLPMSARCNGTPECLAGEDEQDCSGCHGHEFKCKNGNCVPIAWLCDQTDDCKDGSDEHLEQCNTHTAVRNVVSASCNTFRCPTGECLPWSMVCNIHQDCPDGEDEGGSCATSVCKEPEINPCSQHCVRTPHGPKCACDPGYQLAGDGRTCEDVNECLVSDPCAQLCQNTKGSFTCSCVKDFALKADMVSCKSTGEPMEYIFSSGKQIRRSSATLQNVSLVVESVGEISGLDINSQTKTIFWTSAETGEIVRHSLVDPSLHTIRGVGVPGKLAVDWTTDNVYFADMSSLGDISACNIKDQKCARVINEQDGSSVTAIAVDPLAGLLFWSKAHLDQRSGPHGQIMSSDLAGRNIRKLEFRQVEHVTGLAVDIIKRRIYWSDESSRAIQSMDYNGNGWEIITTEEDVRPVDLALFENQLYWLSGESGKMVKCPIHKRAACEADILSSNAKHLRIFHAANQPSFVNLCEEHQCSHLCVVGSGSATCLCRDGTIVNSTEQCLEQRSETPEPTFNSVTLPDSVKLTGSSTASVLGPIAAVLMVLIVLGVIFIYTKRQTKKMDCPVSLGLLGSKPRKVRGSVPGLSGYHFENKSFGVGGCSASVSEPIKPGQHEYINPQIKDDLLDGAETYHDLSDQELDRSRLLP